MWCNHPVITLTLAHPVIQCDFLFSHSQVNERFGPEIIPHIIKPPVFEQDKYGGLWFMHRCTGLAIASPISEWLSELVMKNVYFLCQYASDIHVINPVVAGVQ